MTHARNYLIGVVSADQRNACHQALTQISGSLADTFSIPLASQSDTSDAPPRHYATDANLTLAQATRLKAACLPYDVRWTDAGPLSGRRQSGLRLGDILRRDNLRRTLGK